MLIRTFEYSIVNICRVFVCLWKEQNLSGMTNMQQQKECKQVCVSALCANKMCESERKLSILSIARCLSVQNGKFSQNSFSFHCLIFPSIKEKMNKPTNNPIISFTIYIRFVWIIENCCNYNCKRIFSSDLIIIIIKNAFFHRTYWKMRFHFFRLQRIKLNENWKLTP